MTMITGPNSVIDWDNIRITKHSGETGFAWIRTFETGNVRLRLTEYSPGYRCDHWCCRGHFVHLLKGEICYAFKNGSEFRLTNGMSCLLSDTDPVPHKAYTEKGAFLMIVD